MKKVIIVYNTAEEYQYAYNKFKEDGFDVSVVLGIELALSISGEEIGWLTIVNAEKFAKDYEREN